MRRYRRYYESASFPARWSAADPVSWIAADALDPARPDLQAQSELYNLDAVAYESVMLGLFTIFRGESRDREKPNDICVAFSRDGFHWDRSARLPFLTVSERPGDWNWGNVQSAGGGCLVVGDRLYFYVSGRQGIPGTNLPGKCSTGLAVLRRDGFASLTDQWPAGTPRRVLGDRTSVITRPLRFRGRHLFVNADAAGRDSCRSARRQRTCRERLCGCRLRSGARRQYQTRRQVEPWCHARRLESRADPFAFFVVPVASLFVLDR